MNKKGSANKLFFLLIVVVVSSLVVSLFSLNVLYGISKSNSLLGGELASFSSQGSYCDGNADCPSTACFDSTRLFSVACISDRCDYGHKISDCPNGCSNGACTSSTSTSSSSSTASTSTSSGGVLGTMSQTCINTCDYYGYQSQKCLDCQKTSSITLTSTSGDGSASNVNSESYLISWEKQCNDCLVLRAKVHANNLDAAAKDTQDFIRIAANDYEKCVSIAKESPYVSESTCTFIFEYEVKRINKNYEQKKEWLYDLYQEQLKECDEYCDKVYA
jgi:hypothetical protein